MFKFLFKIKKFLVKPWIAGIITLILLVGTVSAGQNYYKNKRAQANNGEELITAKQVKTVMLDLNSQNADSITTVGTVKAETSIDIIALSGGRVRGLYFDIGDTVIKNQVLAHLQNNQAATSYSTAHTGLANTQNSLEQTRRLAQETIRQAELGVQNALEAVQSAEIGLQTTQDALANVESLQDKNRLDQKENAIISFHSYLNSANNTLDQVNYILDVDDEGLQLAGIDDTLGVKNPTSIVTAENSYRLARTTYKVLVQIEPTINTIKEDVTQAVNLLSQTGLAIDDTIIVLNNTVSSISFSDADLNIQKNSFSTLRSSVVNVLNGAKQTLQGLENINLLNKQELDALNNAVASAQNQLELAQIGYDNALVALDAARQGKEQQLIAGQSAVDSARGQLNLIGSQVADLTIKSPIAGQITSKHVEVGTEVSPGQKVAQVSQTNKVKVEISLPSEDIYRIKIGQSVTIRDRLVGIISLINPAADPFTRKVGVEIIYSNEDNELIPGTFVDVVIPVDGLEKTHSESFFIPLRAVTITQTDSYVFTVIESRAKKNITITGPTQGALIEVLDGLHDGDELIVEENKSLEDGDLVEVVN